jgi:transcription initiation factor IIE alpha subunit
MSITREAFVKGDFTSKHEANDRGHHPILKFLLEKNKAYTSKEIAKAVKLTDSGTRHMLRILKKAGLIKHKAPYFIAVSCNKKK